jgi:hypothetical protein
MPKKVEQYSEERENIIKKIFSILGINEENNMFSLHKLDHDIDKQSEIIALEDEIKKYFLCGEWSCFKKKDIIKRRWLSIIKYVIKNTGYRIISSNIVSKSDDYIHNGTIYFIGKKIKKIPI